MHEIWNGYNLKVTLQDFTVLPTDIFRRCVIERYLVNYLPTILPTELFRRNTFCRCFHIPSLYRSGIQKNIYRRTVRVKKKSFPLGIYRRKIFCRCYVNTDGLHPSVKVSMIFHTDQIFLSVNSSVFLYRRIISVGDGMEYRRHCPMPTDLFRR